MEEEKNKLIAHVKATLPDVVPDVLVNTNLGLGPFNAKEIIQRLNPIIAQGHVEAGSSTLGQACWNDWRIVSYSVMERKASCALPQ